MEFKKLKRKRGGDTPGLKDYVKKSDTKTVSVSGSDAFTKALNAAKAKALTKKSSKDTLNKLQGFKGAISDKELKKISRNTGGAMLKNPKKADLDKDGKLSGYEKKRGMAIEKAMSGKKMGGGLAAATKRLKAQGKMGGGMMQRPMGYDKGGMKGKKKPIIKIAIGVGKAKDYPGIKKIMEMNKKGKKRFNTGGSVTVSSKLGRTKPTKLY